MPDYLAPGVYVEELSTFSHPHYMSPDMYGKNVATIRVKTLKSRWSYKPAVAAFIGFTRQAIKKFFIQGEQYGTDVINQPVAVNNWSEFTATFGAHAPGIYLPDAVYGFFQNGGQKCYIISIRTLDGMDENSASLHDSRAQYFDYQGDVASHTGLSGLEAVEDVQMIACPDLFAGYDGSTEHQKYINAIQSLLIAFCERINCFALLDAPPNLNAQEIRQWRLDIFRADSSFAALYYPWLEIPSYLDRYESTLVPPCGHIAGIYARTDLIQGVHRSPANELIHGTVGLGINISTGEQEMLNPIGVNALQYASGRGIRVWGARTLSMSNPRRQHLRTRRLLNYIKHSIKHSTDWVNFESSQDISLWSQLRYDINIFLESLWRSGALYGERPEDAYFVQCDEETNPPYSRDLGLIIADLGLALERPGEFEGVRVVYKLG